MNRSLFSPISPRDFNMPALRANAAKNAVRAKIGQHVARKVSGPMEGAKHDEVTNAQQHPAPSSHGAGLQGTLSGGAHPSAPAVSTKPGNPNASPYIPSPYVPLRGQSIFGDNAAPSVEDVIQKLRNKAGWWNGDIHARQVLGELFQLLRADSPATNSRGGDDGVNGMEGKPADTHTLPRA